ncbi:MAG: peptidase M23 family protein [Candidatus Peregrinibacteria bacterium GW2011_GWF2_43_17]|nr:MAG: peptidase M23 family protein [Candidatus Peregrinibacteria bacterium GW2011_GWF2_43_17]KKT18500.1 MAG: Peptidase M23 family protein [Candidatus Peregrinibacteria bacterium GW2011_GWA2_43_8]HAU39998.1 hypothetical protein [Candidatus Peregrinibacteria bacterium]
MSQVNEEARKTRHKKFFSIYAASPTTGKIKHGLSKVGRYLSAYSPINISLPSVDLQSPESPVFTPRKFAKNMVIMTLAFFVLISFDIGQASVIGQGAGWEMEEAGDLLALTTDLNLLADQEGYLVKAMPMNGTPTYQENRTEDVSYTVQSGDTLSGIAYRFGLNQDTIMAANSMTNANYLKSGKDLTVPPKDGAYIKVESGDTLESLITEYNGDIDLTKKVNDIGEDNAVVEGEKIFIAGEEVAEKYIASIKPVYTASSYTSTYSYTYSSDGTSYDSVDVETTYASADFVYPTQGVLTCGWKCYYGHYAYDIGNRSQPAIVAASDGTVTTAAYGWNGGYGNYVVIDHGNGYTTLYAHMEELYVSEGEYVTMGTAIGKMGNTGKVWGATGIHLHFEISYDGTKFPACDVGICY